MSSENLTNNEVEETAQVDAAQPEVEESTPETDSDEAKAKEGDTPPVDLSEMSAADFLHNYDQHVGKLTDSVWRAVLETNQSGVFVNRNIAACAFAEVMLRVCVAQAKSSPGGVERFKEILDL